MKLRHNGIEIANDGSDPFSECKLDRRQYAEVLTNIISSYSEGFVLAIDNKWGTGKTTFVKMWRQNLKNEGYKTLYFNAWENDFQEEVIIALLSELEEFKGEAESKFNNLLEKTATFFKKVAPAVAKGVASKAIGNEAVTDIAVAFTEFTTEEVERQIQNFNEKKSGIEDFRKILEEFVDQVDDEKPVVFIIDELDRCRPNYAVEVLEQIKHLFSVPGIVFVLSIDKEQLGNAVRGFYGSDRIDADEYLRRFIDLEYKIPEPNTQKFIEYLYDYFDFKQFMESQERPRDFQHDKDTLRTISLLFYSKSGLSLRQIEKRFARIRLTLRAFNYRQFVFPEIIILISFLDSKYPLVLEKIRNHSYSLQELVNELDTILIPLTNSTDIYQLNFLYASFLTKYEKSYNAEYSDANENLIDKNDSGEAKLSVKSKLEDETESLLNAVQNNRNQMYTRRTSLSFILNKYDLTENLMT